MEIPPENTFINYLEIRLRAASKLDIEVDDPFNTEVLDNLTIDQLHEAEMELMRMERIEDDD